MRRAPAGGGAPAALRVVIAAFATAALVVGCAPTAPTAGPADPPSRQARVTPAPSDLPPELVPTVRTGRTAPSNRIRFVPESLTLPGGAKAAVLPAETVDGELRVPTDVRHVGWWDGSAYAGDPFGSTVIAGHVDSATEGLGFFARLLRLGVGEELAVRGDGHQARYRVIAVRSVVKQALATDSQAFAQDGPHHLVLITCTGRYRRERGGYESNLVVVAAPTGPAR